MLLQEFNICTIKINKLAYVNYGVGRNKGEEVDFFEDSHHHMMEVSEKTKISLCSNCIQKG